MNKYEYIGNRIKLAREAMGITQENLAEAVDEVFSKEKLISVSTIKRIESGECCGLKFYEIIFEVLKIQTTLPIIYNDADGEVYPIQTLSDFILYLPLFKISSLMDILIRLQDNFYDPHYFYKEINILYKEVPDSDAKKFADFYRENPIINGYSTDEDEIRKYYKDYESVVRAYLNLLSSIDQIVKAYENMKLKTD